LQCSIRSLAETGDHWRKGAPCVVIASLRDAGVVDHRPAEAGPDVVELPDQCAAAMRLPAAIVLDAELETLGLADHGEVDILFDAVRQSGDDLQYRIVLVLRVVLVVMIESRTVHPELILWKPVPKGGKLGRGMNAELADELSPVQGVPPVKARLPDRCELAGACPEVHAVPHLPGVPVTIKDPVNGRCSVLTVARFAVRAATPVRHPTIVSSNSGGQHLIEEGRTPAAAREVAIAHDVDHLYLVVAAPQRQASVVSQPAHLVGRLELDLMT